MALICRVTLCPIRKRELSLSFSILTGICGIKWTSHRCLPTKLRQLLTSEKTAEFSKSKVANYFVFTNSRTSSFGKNAAAEYTSAVNWSRHDVALFIRSVRRGSLPLQSHVGCLLKCSCEWHLVFEWPGSWRGIMHLINYVLCRLWVRMVWSQLLLIFKRHP